MDIIDRVLTFRKSGKVMLACAMLALSMSCREACQTSPGERYLNEKYLSSPGVNPFAGDKGEMPIFGTIDQIATEFVGQKGKTYMFSLGFQPTTENISEFEKILRDDFDGEIEIYTNGRPYRTIRYKDFDSFVWHPGKDAYGPVYNFKIESSDIRYSFRPRIRSNKAYTYSFYLNRVRKSFNERFNDFFKLQTQNVGQQAVDAKRLA